MKFAKKTSFLAAALFAGLLTVPASAQQEVSPDHFDDNAAVARAKKPAAKAQAASARSHRTSTSGSAQAKPKAVGNTVLKANAGKQEIASNSR